LHYMDSVSTPPYSVIYIHNTALDTSILTNYSNQFITSTLVQVRSSKFILVNSYFLPNSDIRPHLSLLTNLLQDPTYQNLPIIITGDLNARHTVGWNDHFTNTLGRQLLDFISSHALENHNKGTYTCFTPNGQSVIDLTLTNLLASPLIMDWT